MIQYNNLDKQYKRTIAEYIQERCKTDTFLAVACEKENKSLDGVLNYVKQEARKQAEDNVACIPDSEVFDWAVHYILEDSINCEPKASKQRVTSGNLYDDLVVSNVKTAKEHRAGVKQSKQEQPKTLKEEIQFELEF